MQKNWYEFAIKDTEELFTSTVDDKDMHQQLRDVRKIYTLLFEEP
jgi:hypothetical protein